MSAHIASLEKELNACLLVRSTKGVALSEAGKELYAYAEQMLELEQKIRRGSGWVRAGEEVYCGSQRPLSRPSIYSRISCHLFGRNTPGEQLKVFETDSAGVVDMILNHKADVGFHGGLSWKKAAVLPAVLSG